MLTGKAVVVPLYKAEGSNSDHLHPSKSIFRRFSEERWGTLNTELLKQRQEEPGLFSLAQYSSTSDYTKLRKWSQNIRSSQQHLSHPQGTTSFITMALIIGWNYHCCARNWSCNCWQHQIYIAHREIRLWNRERREQKKIKSRHPSSRLIYNYFACIIW